MGDLGSLFGSYEPPSFSYASEIQPCESDNCSYSTLTTACVLCFNFTHERHYRTLIKVASLAEDYWSHNVLCATHPQPLLQSNHVYLHMNLLYYTSIDHDGSTSHKRASLLNYLDPPMSWQDKKLFGTSLHRHCV